MYKIYCDFDETVSTRDVGSQILARFGTPKAFEIWKEFDSGSMSAAECLRVACETVTDIDEVVLMAIYAAQTLKPGFVEFANYCQAEQLDLRITSDGFSCYIRPILARHGLAHLPIWTNEIEKTDSGGLSMVLPHQREGCDRCASCKCAGILTTSDDADTIVYVGDGYSDWCPAQMADVVFACRDLKRQCGELGIPHHPFEDFTEVQAILENYLRDRPKYRREQAHRKRKELITIE